MNKIKDLTVIGIGIILLGIATILFSVDYTNEDVVDTIFFPILGVILAVVGINILLISSFINDVEDEDSVDSLDKDEVEELINYYQEEYKDFRVMSGYKRDIYAKLGVRAIKIYNDEQGYIIKMHNDMEDAIEECKNEIEEIEKIEKV